MSLAEKGSDGQNLRVFYLNESLMSMGLIPRPAGAGLRLCHSREGGNPVCDVFPGHPPEFTPAKAEAGVTVVTIAQIPRSLLRGSSFGVFELKL